MQYFWTAWVLFILFFSSSVYGQGPKYDPIQFYKNIENNPQINCLSYALDLKMDIPINAASWFTQSDQPYKILDSLVLQLNHFSYKNLGLQLGQPFSKIVNTTSPDANYYLVACYLSHSCDDDGCLSDYHFARQDETGTWSHKLGKYQPTNLDGSGHVITNPREANLHYEYTQEKGELFSHYNFIGYIEILDPAHRAPSVEPRCQTNLDLLQPMQELIHEVTTVLTDMRTSLR